MNDRIANLEALKTPYPPNQGLKPLIGAIVTLVITLKTPYPPNQGLKLTEIA